MKIIFILIIILTASCRPIQETTRDSQAHTATRDTIYIYKQQRDSIQRTDSTFFSIIQRADTVFVTRDRIRIQYRDRLKTDTIYRTRRDTIQIEHTITETIEKPVHFPWYNWLIIITPFLIILYLGEHPLPFGKKK